jgi:hypothetical protein
MEMQSEVLTWDRATALNASASASNRGNEERRRRIVYLTPELKSLLTPKERLAAGTRSDHLLPVPIPEGDIEVSRFRTSEGLETACLKAGVLGY